MRTSIIIASIIAIAIAGALSLVLIWQSSNTQTNTASYYYSIHDNIDGLDQDNGFVTIRGQQYYMVTPQVNYPNDTEINFQSVSFSFPNGNRPALTPGGTIAESIVTFQDGNSYRLAAGIPPDSAAISAVVLTNHVGPQAGLAIYEDRVKVLFSTQKHLEELKIVGLQESYHTGEQVRFSVIADGFDLYLCRDFTASIVGDEQPIFSVPAYNLSCPIPIEPERYELYYPQKGDQFGVVVNKAGTYRLTVQFGDESAQREFAVNPDLGYEIIHGKDTFHVGEQITFQVKTRQIQNVCTAPEYKIIEKDSGKTVWDVPRVVYPCPFSSGPQKIIESTVSFPNEYVKTPIINKTGDYTILIIDGENSSSLDFTVIDETTDIDGHSFYYYTINDTMNSIRGEGKKITFHDVTFTLFPRPPGISIGEYCGNGWFGSSMLFSDGVREQLSVATPSKECLDEFSKDDLVRLTNHTSPQAGLTFSDGKVRLLVSSELGAEKSGCFDSSYELVKNPLVIAPQRLVFFVKQNSEAQLCVRYSSSLQNNGTLQLQPQVYTGSSSSRYYSSDNISITPSQAEVPLGQGSKSLVSYTVAAHGKTGVYWASIPQICDLVPVVVWSGSPGVSPLDIPMSTGRHSCPAQFLDATIAGSSDGLLDYRAAMPAP